MNIENYNKIVEYNVQGTNRRMRLFNKIVSSEEAYLIGYLLGDGSYNAPTSKRSARLGISSIDNNIITNICNYFTPDTSISSLVPINKTRNIKTDKLSYRFTFPSKFKDTFNKFGILSKKDTRNYFNIPKEYMNSMLLGLVDADGFISFGKRKDRNRLWGNITITHQNGNMLSKLQTYLADNLNVITTLNKRATEDCWDLKTSKLSSVSILIKFMLSSNSSIYSTSKREIQQSFLKSYATYTG